jgi:NTE family protein
MDLALALGGGGMRGIAHIGVIRCLEEEGFHIGAIAGASAGSVAGAIYAAGYSPLEMENIIDRVDQKKMFGRKPEDGPSFMGLSGLTDLLTELLGDKQFEDLRLPFAVVCVDLKAGQEVVINQGNVIQAILASSAVPGVFPPKQIGDSFLIDGASLNPVPVNVARWLVPDLPVAAVILSQFPSTEPHDPFSPPIQIPGPGPIKEYLSHLRLAQAFNIFVRSVGIGSDALAELRLQIDRPEAIIRPGVTNVGILDQVNIHDMVEAGYQACKAALPDLKKALSWSSTIKRRLRQPAIEEPSLVKFNLN